MSPGRQIQTTKRKNVSLRLEPTLIERLDKRAEEMGESTRTGLIENMLIDSLDNSNPNTNPNSQTEELGLQDSLEIENPDSGNENDDDSGLTPQEQELFDSGFDMGKEEGIQEGKRQAIIQLNEELANRPDPHSCEFLPWRSTCLNGKCDNANPNFQGGLTPETIVNCDECKEDLGELRDAIRLGKCPGCGESLFGKVKGLISGKGSNSEDDDQ